MQATKLDTAYSQINGQMAIKKVCLHLKLRHTQRSAARNASYTVDSHLTCPNAAAYQSIVRIVSRNVHKGA